MSLTLKLMRSQLAFVFYRHVTVFDLCPLELCYTYLRKSAIEGDAFLKRYFALVPSVYESYNFNLWQADISLTRILIFLNSADQCSDLAFLFLSISVTVKSRYMLW